MPPRRPGPARSPCGSPRRRSSRSRSRASAASSPTRRAGRLDRGPSPPGASRSRSDRRAFRRPASAVSRAASGIPLIPADEHADRAVVRRERPETEVARREVELLVVARIVGNMHLAILADVAAPAVDDDRGVVVQPRRAPLEQADDERDAELASRVPRTRRVVGPGTGSASSKYFGVLALAEIAASGTARADTRSPRRGRRVADAMRSPLSNCRPGRRACASARVRRAAVCGILIAVIAFVERRSPHRRHPPARSTWSARRSSAMYWSSIRMPTFGAHLVGVDLLPDEFAHAPVQVVREILHLREHVVHRRARNHLLDARNCPASSASAYTCTSGDAAEQVVRVAHDVLVRAHQEDPEIVRLALLRARAARGSCWSSIRRHVLRSPCRPNRTSGRRGRRGASGRSSSRCERHDREGLVDRPVIEHRLEHREIAQILLASAAPRARAAPAAACRARPRARRARIARARATSTAVSTRAFCSSGR